MTSNIFKIESNHVSPCKGNVLIAEPFLQGTYFSRSVIILTTCEKEGSMGFVLNKKAGFSISDIMPDFSGNGFDLFVGGPVETDSIFYVHTLGDLVSGSIRIKNNLFWGGDFETIKTMVNSAQISNLQIRFFLGYSGWSSGQLDAEIHDNSWLVADTSGSGLLKINEDEMWSKAVRAMGGKYALWDNFPEHPSHN